MLLLLLLLLSSVLCDDFLILISESLGGARLRFCRAAIASFMGEGHFTVNALVSAGVSRFALLLIVLLEIVASGLRCS